MGAFLNFLGQFVVGWLVPLVAVAILFPFLQIMVFINPILGGLLILAVGGSLCWRAVRQAQDAGIPVWNSWQLLVWGIIFGPAFLLAFVNPYFHLWVLLIEGVVLLLIIGVPGVVLSNARRWFSALLTGELFLSTLLYGATLGRGNVALIVFALLLIAFATILFTRAARPFELRQSQRRAARWAIRLAVIAIILAFAVAWWPLVRGGSFVLTGHDPQTERIVIEKVGKEPNPVTEVEVPKVGHYRPLTERISTLFKK